jgi:aubergine-like protein
MMRHLRFEQIGPKCFNSKAAHKLDAHKIQVWPGFDARLIQKENGVLLNIDVCFRCVRQDTALEFMNSIKEQAEQKSLDPKEEISLNLQGCTVVTRYNNKCYRVERVDFNQTPDTTFDKNGTPISYKEYFKT